MVWNNWSKLQTCLKTLHATNYHLHFRFQNFTNTYSGSYAVSSSHQVISIFTFSTKLNTYQRFPPKTGTEGFSTLGWWPCQNVFVWLGFYCHFVCVPVLSSQWTGSLDWTALQHNHLQMRFHPDRIRVSTSCSCHKLLNSPWWAAFEGLAEYFEAFKIPSIRHPWPGCLSC